MIIPGKEKSKQSSRKACLLISLLIQVKKQEIKSFKSWGSCWQGSSWEWVQWNKLVQCQAHSRCTINVCRNGEMSEWMIKDALSRGCLTWLLCTKSISHKGSSKHSMEIFKKKQTIQCDALGLVLYKDIGKGLITLWTGCIASPRELIENTDSRGPPQIYWFWLLRVVPGNYILWNSSWFSCSQPWRVPRSVFGNDRSRWYLKGPSSARIPLFCGTDTRETWST